MSVNFILPRYNNNHPFIYLRENHSVDIVKKVKNLENYSKNLCCLKQRLRFLHRCKRYNLIPRSLKVKTLVRSREGRKISTDTEKKFLKAGIGNLHCEIRSKGERIDSLRQFLNSVLPEAIFSIILDYIDVKSKKVGEKCKANLIKKFDILQRKYYAPNNAVTEKWVKNLSTRELSSDEVSLLSKGMKFAVSFKTIDNASFLAPIERVLCDLPEKEVNRIRLSLTTNLYSKTAIPENLTRGERIALRQLRSDSSIVILPADKGRTTVVMDLSDYHKKLDDLLLDGKTYEQIDRDPTSNTQCTMNKLLLQYRKEGLLSNHEYNKVHCTNGTIPKFYGLPKIHKENVPLRPIVSFLTSPCYKLSKYLTEILKEYSYNEYSVRTSVEFSRMIRQERIGQEESCISFDVVSLFTSIPTGLACDVALQALREDKELGKRSNLPPENIVKLLKLCLDSTSFVCRGILYKQKFGTAMGSPVSPTIANLVMNTIEKHAMSTFIEAPRLWVRYVDDTFAIIKRNRIDSFLEHLNSINANIQFTMEKEENRTIPFLDVLVQYDETGNIKTSVYRKSVCTDRLLDYNSNHPINQKTSTISTLLKRAESISSDEGLLEKEKNHLFRVFKCNNYPNWIVNSDFKRRDNNCVEHKMNKKRICLPYVKGISESTKRLLGENNILCTFKPNNTLRGLLSHPKDRTQVCDNTNVVYSIPCDDCSGCYIGQTKRRFGKRVEEHQRNVLKKETEKSAIANHMIIEGHKMNWKDSKILHKHHGVFERLFLEGWEVKRNNVLDKNRGTPIPDIYKVLM